MADPDLFDDEEREEEGPGQSWLTTWADMMSVLLTFFIVLQAFSTLSEKKFYEAMSSIQRAFQMPLPIKSPGSQLFDTPRATDQLMDMFEQDEMNGISVQDFGDRVVLTVESGLLFALGSADLTYAGRGVIDQVGRALASVEGAIRVEGHTCDLPVGPSSEFADNWELSAGRALSVLHELSNRGIRPNQLSAVGYGEFRPVAPNDTEENRRQNRRVQFVIERGG